MKARSKKVVVKNTPMEDRPSVTPVEASEAPETSALEDMEAHETSQPQALPGLQTTTSQNRRQPIGTLNPLLRPTLLELPIQLPRSRQRPT